MDCVAALASGAAEDFLKFQLNGYAAGGLQETFMPNHKLKRDSDWRCRREEYLRAAGRDEDLIREGYETPRPDAKLVVIPGGGRRSAQANQKSACLSSSESCHDPDTQQHTRREGDGDIDPPATASGRTPRVHAGRSPEGRALGIPSGLRIDLPTRGEESSRNGEGRETGWQ